MKLKIHFSVTGSGNAESDDIPETGTRNSCKPSVFVALTEMKNFE